MLKVLIIICLMLAGDAVARDAWEYARTDHFEVYSTCRRKETENYIRDLELFRSWFFIRFGGATPYIPRCVVVCLDSSKEMKPYLRTYANKAVEVDGFFLPPLTCPAIVLSTDEGTSKSRQIIFHEYTHLMIEGVMPNAPLWFNEGLAQAFETARVEKENFLAGEDDVDRARVLATHSPIPLRRLLYIQHGSSEYNQGADRNEYYAQTWAFAHYCVFGNAKDYRSKYFKFASLVALGNPPTEELFRQVFGMGYAEMEKILNAYTRNGKYYLSGVPLSELKPSPITFGQVNIEDRDVLLKCIKARVHFDKRDPMYECVNEAERMLRWDFKTQNPLVATFAAATARVIADESVAEPIEQLAIELRTDNSSMYAFTAARLLDRIGFDLDYCMPAETTRSQRAYMERGLAIDPNSEVLLTQLAHIEASSEDCHYSEIDRVQQHVGSMRWREPALFFVGFARLKQKDFKTCEVILRILESSKNMVPSRAIAELRRRYEKANLKKAMEDEPMKVPLRDSPSP